ncbi:hypothetical protein Pla110_33420 [Polystyrenella longa]|uniref:Uncharacterized protein n=1 Tax=Polystyrenella longa TaxID=2528007 RepID=A0A518CQW3_9PLAN|nr:hypothetical protein [Polystyrenella longa]QDU81600.1 hypothetical protein Pla110_33420 [Polystyrenella longa]
MDFDHRLKRAIGRGLHAKNSREQEAQEKQLNEEELRILHSQARIELTEHIDVCLKKLVDHFPGFQYSSVIDSDGWGAKIRRDDLELDSGKRKQQYSQLQLLISSFNKAQVIELNIKGTARNKEVIHRRHFQQLQDLDTESFSELIDLWVLEYAEKYSAGT